jgi:hypothetical protein
MTTGQERLGWGMGQEETMSPVILVISAAVFGTAGGFVGNRKGRMGLGITLGILLGLIGLVIIACIPARKLA